MSKAFRMIADVEFGAENIDDAFSELSKHFQDMADDPMNAELLFSEGGMRVGKVEDFQDTPKYEKRATCIKFLEIIDEWCEENGYEATTAWQHQLAVSLWESLNG